MQLNEEIWNTISATPKLPDEVKKSLHVRIMRLIEESQSNPARKPLGVTIMTQEASLAGDKIPAVEGQVPGNPRPKSI